MPPISLKIKYPEVKRNKMEQGDNKGNSFIGAAVMMARKAGKDYLTRIFFNVKSGFRWILLAVLIGVIVGAAGSSFDYLLKKAEELRLLYPWLLYFLPAGGLIIVFLYRISGLERDRGTNTLLNVVHHQDEDVPAVLAPVIYVSSLITHLFGGSAGREGAALQIGGSIGNTLGRIFHMEEGDRKLLVMSGMSAAFSAVFGTPLAAAIFPMEMISVGIMQYSALLPCIFASLAANRFAGYMGLLPESFFIREMPLFSLVNIGKVIILGVLCAGLSVVFCLALRQAGGLYRRCFENPYLRIVVGGLLVVALTLALGTRMYCGAGSGVIALAIAGECVPPSFFLKIIFTALTLGAGYKGGEIVPSFFVGATFGCLFGHLAGISPSLGAAAGMLAMFCGVTNCPITSMLIGFELFGFGGGAKFLIIAIVISYMFSGYGGLYHDQIIVYSKYHPKYINRISGDEDFSGEDYE